MDIMTVIVLTPVKFGDRIYMPGPQEIDAAIGLDLIAAGLAAASTDPGGPAVLPVPPAAEAPASETPLTPAADVADDASKKGVATKG